MSKYQTIGRNLSQATFNVKIYISQNKWKIILYVFLTATAILTGVFVALKNIESYEKFGFKNFCITKFVKGDLGTWELFLDRIFSAAINLAIIFVCGLSSFSTFIGFVVVLYRAYLIGLSCTFLVALCSVGGVVCTILVIIPCHLLCLALIISYYIFIKNNARQRKLCRCRYPAKVLIATLTAIIALSAVCLIETFLLKILSANIILVI